MRLKGHSISAAFSLYLVQLHPWTHLQYEVMSLASWVNEAVFSDGLGKQIYLFQTEWKWKYISQITAMMQKHFHKFY